MGYFTNDELSHHGVIGQKWGVRRYQNKDGSLTPQGLARVKKEFSESHKTVETSRKNQYISKDFKKKTEYVKDENGNKQERYHTITLDDGKHWSSTYTIDRKYNAVVAKTISNDKIGKHKIVDLDDSEIARGKQFVDEILKKADKQMDDFIDKEMKEEEKMFSEAKASNERAIKSKVENAKKSGKFDMEFLEQNLDQDPKTGENLEGKELYDAYEKYLRDKNPSSIK